MWIDEGVLTQVPEAGPTRHGRPRVYRDAAIPMLLSLKQVFRLPLRALQVLRPELAQARLSELAGTQLHDLEPSRPNPQGRAAGATSP